MSGRTIALRECANGSGLLSVIRVGLVEDDVHCLRKLKYGGKLFKNCNAFSNKSIKINRFMKISKEKNLSWRALKFKWTH